MSTSTDQCLLSLWQVSSDFGECSPPDGLSGCTALESVTVDAYNFLGGPKDWEASLSALSSAKSLRTLKMSRCARIRSLAPIAKLSALTELEISDLVVSSFLSSNDSYNGKCVVPLPCLR